MAEDKDKLIQEQGETAFSSPNQSTFGAYGPTGSMGKWFARFFSNAAKPYIALQGQNALIPKDPQAGDLIVNPERIKVTTYQPTPYDGPEVLVRNVLVPQYERTRKQRYAQLESMDTYAEVTAAFDVYANDATQQDTIDRLWLIESESPIVKDEVERFFKTIDLERHYWDIIRNICKYGDCFAESIIDENNPNAGIQRIKILNPNYILRIENIYGYLTGFLQEIPRNLNNDYSDFGSQADSMSKNDYITIDKNQITHFRIHTSDPRFYPYGRSVAAGVMNTFKSLRLMEDAVLIYRLTRSTERRVFYINTANLPANKATAFVETMKKKLKKEKFYDSSTGAINEKMNPLCLTGDTKIPLLNGKTLSIEEIMKETKEGDNIEVWASDGKKLVPATATRPFISGVNAKIVKVTLDNGQEIKCTPEHKFMLRDGTYKEARDLLVTDSLFPFYSRINKNGYLEVQEKPGEKWKLGYKVIAENIFGEEACKGKQIHHINEIKLDNSTTNLIPLHAWEHMKIHGISPLSNAKNNRSNRCKTILMQPEIVAKRKLHLEKLNKEKKRNGSDNPHWKGGMFFSECQYCKKQFGHYKCQIGKKKFCSRDCTFNARVTSGKYSQKYFNHKIISVEFCGISHLVYDITVPKYHNFALNSVIVHNSIDEDLFIPHRGDKETRVEVLQGASNLNAIDDVKYFLDKVLAGLQVPRDFIVESKDKGAERKANLSQLDVKFAKTVSRVQAHFIEGLESLTRVHLKMKKIPQHLINTLRIKLPDPSDMFTKRKLEIDEAKTRVVTGMVGTQMFPKNWLYKQYWNLDDDEIEKLKKELEEEMEEMAEQQSMMAPDMGPDGGPIVDDPNAPPGESPAGSDDGGPQPPGVGGRSGNIKKKQPGSAGMDAPANENKTIKFLEKQLLNEENGRKRLILHKIKTKLEKVKLSDSI